MTAITFPDPAGQSPANTYSPTSTPDATSNGATYIWDGQKWETSTVGFFPSSGGTVSGNITVTGIGTFQSSVGVSGNVTAASFSGDGSGLTNLPAGLVYEGNINVTDPAPQNPEGGDFYTAEAAGTVDESFTGIGGRDVNENQILMYSAGASKWFTGASGASGTFLPTSGGTITGNLAITGTTSTNGGLIIGGGTSGTISTGLRYVSNTLTISEGGNDGISLTNNTVNLVSSGNILSTTPVAVNLATKLDGLVDSNGVGYASFIGSSVAMTSLAHYSASYDATNSTLPTTQYGFYAASTLTTATNAFAFYSEGNAPSQLGGALTVTGDVGATTFTGSGASLTSLNATNLSSGTVPSARLPAPTGTSKGAVYAGNNITITAAGQISATDTTLPAASTTILGGIYLGSDAENTAATNSPTNTATRSYPLQNDANGKAVVNVPWETNTNTVTSITGGGTAVTGTVTFEGSGATVVSQSTQTITISSTDTTYGLAGTDTLGLIEVGYTTSGKNYAVQLSGNDAFVNVPWTDTDTTYGIASSDTLGLIMVGTNLSIDGSGVLSSTNTTYGLAGTDTLGLIEVGYTTSVVDRNYAVTLDGNDAFVNVPWTDTDTTYGRATTTALGLIEIGYTTSVLDRNYAVQLDGNDAFVNVPWTDNHTTYTVATDSTLGLVKIGAGSLADKSYAIQLNASEQMFVTVPWTDNNTTYGVAGTNTLGLIEVGYTTSVVDRNYAVTLDGNDAFVNVPWENDNTTYGIASSDTLGLIRVGTNLSITDAGILSSSYVNTTYDTATDTTLGLVKIGASSLADKSYAIQLNNSDQMFVTVPWTDNNTTYGIASTDTLGLIRVGNNLSITDAGILSSTNTTYGIASTDTLGLIRVGNNLSIDSNSGILSSSYVNTTYVQATSSDLGLVKIGASNLGSKNYPIQLNGSGQMFVDVPWTDANTTYGQATSSDLGLVKIGAGNLASKNYAIQLNNSGQMFVDVPWTDTDTTYGKATATSLGLIQTGYGANGQYYPVSMSDNNAYVYVPWQNDNTTYGVATDNTLGLIQTNFPYSAYSSNARVKMNGNNAYVPLGGHLCTYSTNAQNIRIQTDATTKKQFITFTNPENQEPSNPSGFDYRSLRQNTNLYFNITNAYPSGFLNSPLFRGPLEGNADTATTAASCSGNANTATTAASCSGNSLTASQINVQNGAGVTDSYVRILFIMGQATGNQYVYKGSGCSINPTTNYIKASGFNGDGGSLTNLNASKLTTGNVDSARLSGTYSININGNASYASDAGTLGGTSAGSLSVNYAAYSGYTNGSSTSCSGVSAKADQALVATRDDIGGYRSCLFTNTNSTYYSIQNCTKVKINSSTGDMKAVSYSETSDYRVKKDIVSLSSSIDIVKALNPVSFNWDPSATVPYTEVDDDGVSTVNNRTWSMSSSIPEVGFIAHEVQALIPAAVKGEKDGDDIQTLQTSSIVPVLTKALQEALTKIETLEQRLASAGIA